jgi:hypothetical protein
MKRYDALVMWTEAHLPVREIAKRLNVSPTRAHEYIHEGLAETREQSVDLARYARDREVAVIEMEIREAVDQLLRPCDVCKGRAVSNLQACPTCHGAAVKPGTKDEVCERCDGSGKVGEWCRECERTGFFYGPDQRLRAIDRIRRSSDARAKLLFLYDTPVESEIPYDQEFYEQLQQMSDDELERELEALMVPITTEPEKKAARKKKAPPKPEPPDGEDEIETQ